MSTRRLVNRYRDLIVGVDKLVPLKNGERVTGINFDNAATTPPLESVVREVIRFAPWYSSVHRGTGYKSQLSSAIYEQARMEVLKFVNADPSIYTAVFVKNATEGINKLSYRLFQGKENVVISTWMEHHSNDLPWRDKFTVKYVDIDNEGRLCLEDLENKLIESKGQVRLVTVTGASNVTGYTNDIHKIARMAHKYNAKILVDGAQLVPHMPVDMMPEDEEARIDFLVFSAHKMYAPFGIGVIVAPIKCLRDGCPEYKGGGTVQVVTRDIVDWDEPPYKDEAGSPNIIGVKALMAAMKELNRIGMKNLVEFEKVITDYTIEKMKQLPQIHLYGDTTGKSERVGIIPFNVTGIPHYEVAEYLSDMGGIAVRNGCFCAQPYAQRLLNISQSEIDMYRNNKNLKKPGMVRVSFGLYNTFDEVDEFIKCLNRLVKSGKIYR